EVLDHAEDVVPPPGVQTRRVVTEGIEDLLHLERRQDRLDQDRRANAPLGDSQRVLREDEHVVPQRSLLAALQLREIDVRPRTTLQECTRVVVEEETEVEERRRDRRPVDPNVALLQVPPPWPDDQRRHT